MGRTSLSERMKILDVVIGSNHFLIHPQTVGKNEGAPIIYIGVVSFSSPSKSYRDLQRCGLEFPGNVLLPIGSRLACDHADSKIV